MHLRQRREIPGGRPEMQEEMTSKKMVNMGVNMDTQSLRKTAMTVLEMAARKAP